MTTSYRVLALDIDGTLLTSDGNVTDRSKAAVRAVAESGVRIVIVTGRNLPKARLVADLLPAPTTVIAHNGAICADSDGRILRAEWLTHRQARRLCELFRRWDCEPCTYTVRHGAFELRHPKTGVNPGLARYLEANAFVTRPVADVVHLLEEGRTVHVVAIERAEKVRRVVAGMSPLDGTRIMTSGGLFGGEYWFLEAIHARASKDGALRSLCADWQVPFSEVVAIGDNLNDIELLRTVGVGIAMGNAPEAVKAVADRVTGSNDEDGIAEAVEWLLGARS